MSVIPEENKNIGKADAEKAMRKLLSGARNPQAGNHIRANIRRRNEINEQKKKDKEKNS